MLLVKLYQRSDRAQYSGSSLLASWPRSATLIVACVASVRLLERVPRMSVMNCQPGSVSIAEWVPRKPPPARKYVLERGLLRVVEHVAARVEEHDGAVGGQVGGGELARVAADVERHDGRIDRGLERGCTLARADGRVLREDEDVVWLSLRRGHVRERQGQPRRAPRSQARPVALHAADGVPLAAPLGRSSIPEICIRRPLWFLSLPARDDGTPTQPPLLERSELMPSIRQKQVESRKKPRQPRSPSGIFCLPWIKSGGHLWPSPARSPRSSRPAETSRGTVAPTVTPATHRGGPPVTPTAAVGGFLRRRVAVHRLAGGRSGRRNPADRDRGGPLQAAGPAARGLRASTAS